MILCSIEFENFHKDSWMDTNYFVLSEYMNIFKYVSENTHTKKIKTIDILAETNIIINKNHSPLWYETILPLFIKNYSSITERNKYDLFLISTQIAKKPDGKFESMDFYYISDDPYSDDLMSKLNKRDDKIILLKNISLQAIGEHIHIEQLSNHFKLKFI